MLTSSIKNTPTIYNNQYQGTDVRLLFVCAMGMLRSPTCANAAVSLGFNARSCGWDSQALIQVSDNLVRWAHHIIFVDMEAKIKTHNLFEFGFFMHKSCFVIGIDDDYEYNDPYVIQKTIRFLNTNLISKEKHHDT